MKTVGRPSTGERLEVKSGPSWVLPLKAARESVHGEVVVEGAIVDDEVIVEDVVMSDTIDGGFCSGEDGTVSCSRVCSRMLNSRL